MTSLNNDVDFFADRNFAESQSCIQNGETFLFSAPIAMCVYPRLYDIDFNMIPH